MKHIRLLNIKNSIIMKKILLSIIGIIASVSMFAQAPNAFNYQAVARASNGDLITNQTVSFRISILQGSTSGTAVYSETHDATTNKYGLVNLQIGNGTTSDDFTTINWANGPYFVKVEMDATGGTTYAEMGTSQLLSVPYAITASNIVAKNEYGKYFKLKIIDDFGNTEWEYVSPDTMVKIDFKGNLYVYPVDNSTGIQWYNGSYITTNATDTLNGAANTDSIVKYQGAGAYAAYLCDTLSAFGHNDWYLPARDELNAMYQNKAIIGGFSSGSYWSSTEGDGSYAWYQAFTNGAQGHNLKYGTNRVRCVRRD